MTIAEVIDKLSKAVVSHSNELDLKSEVVIMEGGEAWDIVIEPGHDDGIPVLAIKKKTI